MENRISIAQIKILGAVAREKNFSRAARCLGISQPAVSLQIKKLQAQFGVGIYFRRGKAIHLSDLGMDLVKTGRRVLGLLNEMDASLREAGELLSGRLRIGLSCHYFVKDLLAGFMARYPGIRVKADIGNSEDLLAAIGDCRLDIAQVTGLEPDPRFHNLKYADQEILVFVAKSHPWAGKGEIAFSDLHNQDMVSLHPPSMTRQIFHRRLSEEGVRPKIALELDNWEAMKEMVAAGIGFGIALEDELGPDDRLKKIRLSGDPVLARQYFVCQPEYRELKLISAFLDIVRMEKESREVQLKLSGADAGGDTPGSTGIDTAE